MTSAEKRFRVFFCFDLRQIIRSPVRKVGLAIETQQPNAAANIGAKNGNIEFYSGLMAFAAIWNIRVSDSDITALANGLDPLRISPQALVAYVPQIFDGGLGIDLKSTTAWTLTGSGPTYSGTAPTAFMRRHGRTIPFFATQNAQITFSPVVKLTLTPVGGVDRIRDTCSGVEVTSNGRGMHSKRG